MDTTQNIQDNINKGMAINQAFEYAYRNNKTWEGKQDYIVNILEDVTQVYPQMLEIIELCKKQGK